MPDEQTFVTAHPLPAPKYCLALNHLAWTRGDAATTAARTIETARLIDGAGFDSLWLNEDPDGWDAIAVLSAVARETASLRLGTGVTNPYHRHPNLIAASVATLDRLSGGRAFLGLGRGQPEWFARALGLPVWSPLALLDETFDLLDQWWGDRRDASSTGPLAVRDWERAIAPLGRPPIYLAAVGPKALKLAGRRADGVLFNELASLRFVRHAIDVVRTAAKETGRGPESLLFFVNPAATVTDDPEPALERKKGLIALVHALPGMERLIDEPDFDITAIMTEVRRAMKTDEIIRGGGGFPALRRGGDLARARAAIPTALVDRLAAIGPTAHVRDRLRAFRAVGVTHLFLDPRGLPLDRDALRQLMDALS